MSGHVHSGMCANGADCEFTTIIDNDVLARLKPTGIPFVCPRCKSTPNEHGIVPRYAKSEHGRETDCCEGVLCECEHDTAETHGETFEDPCLQAHCGCCGWAGRLPALPKKMLPWERKALEAGWTPPAAWNPSDRPRSL